jgi:hypothetical protein
MQIVEPAGTHKGKEVITPPELCIPKLTGMLLIAKYFP